MWDTALFAMCPITIRSIIIMRFGLFWWMYTKWIQDATRILLNILTIVTEYLRHKWLGNVLMAIQSISYSWSSCCSICPLWGTSIAINRRFLIKCVNNFRSMTSSVILLKINEYRWVLCNQLMWKENWLKNVNNFKMEAKTILLPC
jgi:hypothetical protein